MRAKQRDEFGDLTELRKKVRVRAARLGHQLGKWHTRSADDTKADSFCTICNRLAVTNTEPGNGLPETYGHALTKRCTPKKETT